MAKPLWLFSYDISCAKRLKKVHKLCSEAGWALQKSVFVIALTRQERLALCKILRNILEFEDDKLLCIPFTTTDGSFHLGNHHEWLLVHDDERLNSFVF